jgi:hypothetical protein
MATANARATSQIAIIPLAGVVVIGAALGTAWDLMHVRLGATVYSIGPDRQPLWVPLEFSLVYLVGVLAIARIGRPRPESGSVQRLAREALWVTAVYATTAIGHEREWLVVALVATGLLARRCSMSRVVQANPIATVALVAGGPAIESVLIAAGLFRYEHASLGNVPVWLPLLYASAVPFAVRLTETALYMSGRRARDGV